VSVLPMYQLLTVMKFVRGRDSIIRASLQLERWHIFMSQSAISKACKEIAKQLDIEIDDEFEEFMQSSVSGGS